MGLFNRDKNKDINRRKESLVAGIEIYKKAFKTIREQFTNQPDVMVILDNVFSIGRRVGRAEFGIEVDERLRK